MILMEKFKRPLMWAIIIFCVYAVIQSPDQAANMVKTATNGVAQGLKSVGNFFDALLAD